MMEYAGNATAAQTLKPSPELGKLKSAAERISRATNNVENFLRRFHGAGPDGGDTAKAIEDSYRNDLEAVFTAIDRLEMAVNSLDHIG